MNEEMMEMEMVDDDQIENVGIMSGFMDDIEELMAEISEEEMNGMEEGDEADMAQMMNRTPDSPEILMNNLRGDMRSIDARREELADLVGMREAEETPEGVLALLQPVLAQQDAVAAMPMPMPAPPMPAPPMPPMPAQPTGIETISVDETVVPAMYKGGSVQNFNRGSGQMGVTPAQRFSPSDVRYYQTGTPEEGVVSSGRFSPAAVASADQYIKTLLESQPSATALDLPTLMGQEAKLYESLGLGTPKEDVQSQILFDIAQAALQYGSNVGPDGKPMAGSQAAKLAQIGAPLAGRVGARAGEMSKEANALKMLALQSAQGKIATAQAADIALAKQQGDLAIEIAKQDPAAKMLTDVEVTEMGLDPDEGTWFVDGKGVPKLAGGRKPVPLIESARAAQTLDVMVFNNINDSLALANSAQVTQSKVAQMKEIFKEAEENDAALFVGPLGETRQFVSRVVTVLGGDEGKVTDSSTALAQTSALLQQMAILELEAAAKMRGQGQITENERKLIAATAGGKQANTVPEIKALIELIDNVAKDTLSFHDKNLDKARAVYEGTPDIVNRLEFFEVGNSPYTIRSNVVEEALQSLQ
jgi:hypothetical protein